jgi:hypothetical protein
LAASASSFSISGNVLFAFCGALPASFVPSRLGVPGDTMPLAGQQPQRLAEQPAQGH